MNITEFNNSNYRSPGSNFEYAWNFNHALKKIHVRSQILSEYHLLLNSEVKGECGDKDIVFILNYETSSQWTDSPPVHLKIVLPVHVTVNNDLVWDHGIDHQPADLSEFIGVLTIEAEHGENIEIKFTLNEISEKQLEWIQEIFWKVVEREQNQMFLEKYSI